MAFYFAGFLNLVLGLYVLINGRSLVEPGTWTLLLLLFFGFAGVDFWFAGNLKKQWREAQARLAAQGAPAAEKGDK
jgi:hypothetical protein